MIGRHVEITSTGGIVYGGRIRTIRAAGTLGELFELGSDDPGYRRLVYVADRTTQIRELPDAPIKQLDVAEGPP
jgi:hypothetical protein